MDPRRAPRLDAARAHAHQFRRDGFTPYFNHVAAVADRCSGESEVVIVTAYLHDLLEDTMTSPASLREAGYPDSVVDAVYALTKREEVAYEDYLSGVKSNWIARKVKIADMLSNLADNPTEKHIIKYAKGLQFLLT